MKLKCKKCGKENTMTIQESNQLGQGMKETILEVCCDVCKCTVRLYTISHDLGTIRDILRTTKKGQEALFINRRG